MNPSVKALLAKIPGVRALRDWQRKRRIWRTFPGSAEYWQRRYSDGGNSGSGSYGYLAEFKAEVINDFVREQQIESVIELGCGDGNQLLYAIYPLYIGLDVAREAIRRCRERFHGDSTKSFFFYDPECFIDRTGVFRADLALSLDVLYHLVEDHVFMRYMELLFQTSRRFVIIYSSNYNETTCSPHERERRFTDYVDAHFPQWQLIDKIENRYPLSKYPALLGSHSDFYIYERKNGALHTE